ncbi:MAG: metallophosphoesterase family protein [Thermodesulfobacteriota bacterium]
MFKFLHTADIHLDSPLLGLEGYADAPVAQIRQATRRAFDNLVELAIVERVAFVLIAGDLFDGDWKDYNTGLFLADRLGRLRREGIRVFMASGNHDAASQITRSLRLPDNARVFAADRPESELLAELGVVIHGQGYRTRAVTDNLAQGFPAPHPYLFNIGLLHTSLTGRPGHEAYAPCSLDDLRAKGYDYWALGHVHCREEVAREPWVVFPGNPQGRHIRETGPKGATIVVVEEGRVAAVEERHTDVLRWVHCQVDAGGCQRLEELDTLVREAFEQARAEAGGRPVAARLSIAGETELAARLHADQAALVENFRAIGAELGDLWLEKLILRPARPAELAGVVGPDTPLAGLLRAISETVLEAEDPAALVPEIASLKAKLPAELLHGDDPFLALSAQRQEELEAEIRELLVARLIQQAGQAGGEP